MTRKVPTPRRLQTLAAMRAARSRKRMESATLSRECGFVFFAGPAFGGCHVLRLLDGGDESRLWIEADGLAIRPRTARGIRAMLARILQRAERRVK